MSSVDHVIPPQSRFATYTDGIPDTSVIDWEQVGTEEPEQVVKWIQYMRDRDDSHVEFLLPAMFKVMGYGSRRPPQFTAFVRSGLPYELIDIASDPTMFVTSRSRFRVSASTQFGQQYHPELTISIWYSPHTVVYAS